MIVYTAGRFQLQGFSVANHDMADPDYDKRRSSSGIMLFLSDGPISFASRIQKLPAQSSTESELIALAQASKEAVYLSNMLGELGFNQFNTVPIVCDNTASLSLAANGSFSSRTKHIALRFALLRLYVDNDKIRLHHVGTCQQPSDILTKFLGKPAFDRCAEIIKCFRPRKGLPTT